MDTAMMDPATLQGRMTAEEAARVLLKEYIDKNLREGTDYGAVIDRRGAKPSLLKPGAEKMCLLLQLRPHFVADRATLAMAGNPPGLFAYICKLVHTPTGVIIGEGRGAADLNEKKWSVNNAVKIATKRAQVDAVLRVAALSDFFTQDLEDGADDAADRAYQAHQAQQRPREQPQEPRNRPQATPNPPPRPNGARPPAGRASEPDPTDPVLTATIRNAVATLGWGAADCTAYLKQYGVARFSELTGAQLKEVIPDLCSKAAEIEAA